MERHLLFAHERLCLASLLVCAATRRTSRVSAGCVWIVEMGWLVASFGLGFRLWSCDWKRLG